MREISPSYLISNRAGLGACDVKGGVKISLIIINIALFLNNIKLIHTNDIKPNYS